ncbi:MAG: CRISPR-associated endonuclease Cas2 [Alphaproteobacteria bacterium]|nr:CRISPR-associated endonuclease Cas2 [Alphaproteobacteria bacterium]
MARGEMLTVFSYDVSQDKRRRKIAHLLEDNATRVQYSVFEVRISRQKTEALCQRLAAHLGEGDSLRVYVIGHDGERRSRVFGDGAPFESDAGYWLL